MKCVPNFILTELIRSFSTFFSLRLNLRRPIEGDPHRPFLTLNQLLVTKNLPFCNLNFVELCAEFHSVWINPIIFNDQWMISLIEGKPSLFLLFTLRPSCFKNLETFDLNFVGQCEKTSFFFYYSTRNIWMNSSNFQM